MDDEYEVLNAGSANPRFALDSRLASAAVIFGLVVAVGAAMYYRSQAQELTKKLAAERSARSASVVPPPPAASVATAFVQPTTQQGALVASPASPRAHEAMSVVRVDLAPKGSFRGEATFFVERDVRPGVSALAGSPTTLPAAVTVVVQLSGLEPRQPVVVAGGLCGGPEVVWAEGGADASGAALLTSTPQAVGIGDRFWLAVTTSNSDQGALALVRGAFGLGRVTAFSDPLRAHCAPIT